MNNKVKKRTWKAWAIMCGNDIWGRGTQNAIYTTRKKAVESLNGSDPKRNIPPLWFKKVEIVEVRPLNNKVEG